MQHGVITRLQLIELGFSRRAIQHRLATGRLYLLPFRGVYAVGRPQLTQHGRWMAAVLACGTGAVLSHHSAAELWGIRRTTGNKEIHVTVPASGRAARSGIVAHRRTLSTAEIASKEGIPLTAIATTLVDLAAQVSRKYLEAAVNEADKLDLIDPENLRRSLESMPRRHGLRALRDLLDKTTFTLTDSELERRFLRIAKSAGLPKPKTQTRVNGFKVDFYWRDLKLVVETDGLRYHRTPQQQAKDRLRDQRHTAAGLTPLRFTHAQIAHDPAHVTATLTAVAQRSRSAGYSARKRGRSSS
jgi:very-short-patch-repair endonuclease